MAFPRERAFAALASLKPAQVFLDSYRFRLLPENLDIYFGPPEEFFLTESSSEAYTRGGLIPILDNGNFDTVTFLDPATGELAQIDVETPGESRDRFVHWQQYLANLMIVIGESIADDERLRRIAVLIGFDYTDALFDFYTRIQHFDGERYWESRRQFLHALPRA